MPEVSIVTNAPAVTLEEVVPSATADASLLAPGEVATSARRPVKGETERDATDKKRERRLKKNQQRRRAKTRAEKEKRIAEQSGKDSKQALSRKLQKQAKLGKLEIVQGSKSGKGDKALSSSSAFFSRLQDEVASSVSGSKGAKRRREEKNHNLVASHLKL